MDRIYRHSTRIRARFGQLRPEYRGYPVRLAHLVQLPVHSFYVQESGPSDPQPAQAGAADQLQQLESEDGQPVVQQRILPVQRGLPRAVERLILIEREKLALHEEVMARNSALQAQIAPHFIHNVLYLISIAAQENLMNIVTHSASTSRRACGISLVALPACDAAG